MRTSFTLLAVLAPLVLAGCSMGSNADPSTNSIEGSDAGTSHGSGANDASTGDTGDDDAGVATTDWQTLYTQYFAESTVGHCAACHASGRGGFTTGSTADSMYQGMIAYGLIDTANPTASSIGNANQSVLSWYNVPEQGATTLDGRMPDDDAVANSTAAAAVTAWVAAGARNHGALPSGGTTSGDDDSGTPATGADAGQGDDDDASAPVDASAPDSGTKTDAGTDTWTYLYTNWFGPNTPGHCGNSYCHRDSGSSGGKDLVCGTSQSACYSGMVSAGLVSTTSPSTSKLGNPTTTPLSWFGHGGGMPQDEKMTDSAGASAVTAWLNAGAKND